jgi:hypothetical protein
MGEDQHDEKRFGAAAQAAEWDGRYTELEGARWSSAAIRRAHRRT